MALRPAPDLDPRLSARHPLRKQRSAAGREPRPRADPPTATYPHTTASEAPAVLGALLLWTACGAIRASPHAGMLSWSAARAPQRAHRQAHLVFRSWFPVRSDDFPCNTHTIIATTFVKVSTIQGNCWFPSKWSTFLLYESIRRARLPLRCATCCDNTSRHGSPRGRHRRCRSGSAEALAASG